MATDTHEPQAVPADLMAHFRRCAIAFMVVLFVGFAWYRVAEIRFKDDLGIPAWRVKGLDFRAYYVFATDLVNGRSPYTHDTAAGPNPYPPFYSLFVAPFVFLKVENAYTVWVVLSVVAFVAVIRCALAFGHSPPGKWLLVVAAALVLSQTYPVPFVWERGTPEFFILLFMAVGLLLLTRRWYLTAIGALTIATHFKLYPLILGAFVLLRGGWKWATAFTGLVLAAFFILGWDNFTLFRKVLAWTMRDPTRWIWPGNHSVKSFELWCEKQKWMTPDTGWWFVVGTGATLVIVFCWMLWGVYRRRSAGARFSAAETSLLGMAFCLMCLLPTFSHDYKLAQQFFPLLLLMLNPQAAAMASRSRTLQVLSILLAGVVASLFLPLIGEFPKTLQLLVAFGLYTAVTELHLRPQAALSAGGS
jgi:hypothetical protein